MDAELQFHLERQVAGYVETGMTPEEARRRAKLEFGGLEPIKQDCREARRASFIETLIQDVRYASRMLRKNPGFTIAAAVTLALGIGANTAISSIVNAAILRPLPYKDSSRIVSLSTHAAMFPTFSLGLSWVDFQQIRSQASSLEEAAAYADGIKTLTGKGDPVVLRISSVSDDFFAELGIGAQAGRLLTEQDERPGREHVVVLSDALWRNRLGAQPSTVGQTLVLDRVPYTVIGISARGFAFPEKTEAWIPLSFYVSGKAEPHIFHAPRARKDPPRAKNRKTYGGVRHNRAAHHERCSGVECRLQTAP